LFISDPVYSKHSNKAITYSGLRPGTAEFLEQLQADQLKLEQQVSNMQFNQRQQSRSPVPMATPQYAAAAPPVFSLHSTQVLQRFSRVFFSFVFSFFFFVVFVFVFVLSPATRGCHG
jgi:hypothetical protein